MAKDALIAIVDAESKAKEIVKKAKEDAKKIVNEAEALSAQYMSDVLDKGNQKISQLKSDAEDETKSEIDLLLGQNQRKCDEIARQAEQNIDTAKKFLVERIVK